MVGGCSGRLPCRAVFSGGHGSDQAWHVDTEKPFELINDVIDELKGIPV